ncbi:hypothetical protein BHE74_00027998 [Ensete ventricosum]|nr:hypothetical protein BHE74_00027998 [Ensete ventricosum]RZS15867.1 hypothetical protein BHM03_00047764 [Ensete ventricosum]
MGCGGSKLEEEAAVAHCRDRSQLLADAIRYRYALADAHAAYARSLRSVGDAIQGFIHGAPGLPSASPVLPLPAQRKGDPVPPPAAAASVPSAVVRGHSRSDSGSHIQFHPTDSDDDSLLHSDGASPIHHLHADDAPVGPTYVNLNYARNRPAESSVAYEQPPQSSEPIRLGSVDEQPHVAYPYYGYQYPPQSSNLYPYPSYPYMSYGDGTQRGFLGSSSRPPNIRPPAVAEGASSTSREPPPPPAPQASTWDFLNPFDSWDNYYPAYTPSRSSRELREEEGIPDLEDEDHEVVKEAYGDTKFVPSTSPAVNGEYAVKAPNGSKEGVVGSVGEDPHRQSRSIEEGRRSEHEVHVVEKSVVTEPAVRHGAMGFPVSRSYQDVFEVVQEIKTQFDRASESANQVSKMLEVGRVLYQQKNSPYKDSIVSGVKHGDPRMDALKQLEFKMVDWISNFSVWVTVQRNYVKSLNGWLVKGIHYVPEVTDDGVVPFSPGRLGAPPVFVICNYWSQSVDRISERDVVDAVHAFADNVFNIWQQHKVEQQQRLSANRDMDSKLRSMEKEEQQMLKQKRKLMLISSENGVSISEHVVQQGSGMNSLQLSLKQIFEAMENFTADSMKAYEFLHKRSEEEKQRFTRENEIVS